MKKLHKLFKETQKNYGIKGQKLIKKCEYMNCTQVWHTHINAVIFCTTTQSPEIMQGNLSKAFFFNSAPNN